MEEEIINEDEAKEVLADSEVVDDAPVEEDE